MNVGLLHPGAMGTFLGTAVAAAGHDVLWVGAGRSAATRERAAGFTEVATLAEIARTVAAAGFTGLYVDANAVSARTVEAVAELLTDVVDGAVIGGPTSDDAVFHLAGDRAIDAAAIFDPTVVRTHLHDGPLGTASTLNACYAASSKAVTALLLACRAAARAGGVEDAPPRRPPRRPVRAD